MASKAVSAVCCHPTWPALSCRQYLYQVYGFLQLDMCIYSQFSLMVTSRHQGSLLLLLVMVQAFSCGDKQELNPSLLLLVVGHAVQPSTCIASLTV